MTTTHGSLIEKMETVIYDQCGTTRWEDGSVSARDVARLLLAVVLAHYSNPANVSDGMVEAFWKEYQEPWDGQETQNAFAAAMKGETP